MINRCHSLLFKKAISWYCMEQNTQVKKKLVTPLLNL